jgi:hypothetical protein
MGKQFGRNGVMLAAQVVDSVGQIGRIPMIRRGDSALAVRGFEMGCEPGYAEASNRPLSSKSAEETDDAAYTKAT